MTHRIVQPNVYAGRAQNAMPCQSNALQNLQDRMLEAEDKLLDIDALATEVDQHIGHHLPRSMKRDLPTPVGLYHRNARSIKHMLGSPGQTLGKHGLMLDQPDFVGRVDISIKSELAHPLNRLHIVFSPEESQFHPGIVRPTSFVLIGYRTNFTMVWLDRAR